jgi:hypothetical protein
MSPPPALNSETRRTTFCDIEEEGSGPLSARTNLYSVHHETQSSHKQIHIIRGFSLLLSSVCISTTTVLSMCLAEHVPSFHRPQPQL